MSEIREIENDNEDEWTPDLAASGRPSIPAAELRYLLVAELTDADRPMTIADLIEVFVNRGFVIAADGPFPDQPDKVVSDSLRWETAKGRVRSPSRGTYTAARMPRSTKSWIRRRAREYYELHSPQAPC